MYRLKAYCNREVARAFEILFGDSKFHNMNANTIVCLWVNLWFTISMLGQSIEEVVYTFQNGEIQVNENFQVSSNIGEQTGITPYKEVGNISIGIDSENYNLNVQNFNGWRGDGGTFRIIKLYNNTELMLEFIDEKSWRDPYSEFKESVGKYASFNDFCLVYPLQNGATALLFEGFSWASQVPLLTIIVIKDNKAKVVFNKDLAINKFNAHSKGFELTLIDDFDNPSNTYKLHTTTEGTMNFLKVE